MSKKTNQHTSLEIFQALTKADVAAVATHEGVHIKQRQMHFSPNKDLSLYFATMKGDPKTLQITNNSSVSVLVLDRSGDMQSWSETEYSGQMKILTSEKDIKIAAKEMYSRSPIVKNLVDAKMDYILEWIVLKPKSLKHRVFGEIVQGFPPTIKQFGKQDDFSLAADIKSAWQRFKIWYLASRATFLTATILPILLGVSVAYYKFGVVSAGSATITLLAGVLLHLSANLLNDYMDHLGGSDAANTDFARPFTGGSRVIQLGIVTPAAILTASFFCGLAGLGLGIYLAATYGALVWLLGAFGLFTLIMYSVPKVGLASNGLGEVAMGVVFGPLMTVGAYYVQTGQLARLPILASLPVAALIAMVLFINEFPDIRADKKVGKDTLVVRLGLHKSANIYLLTGLLSSAVLIYFIVSGVLPAETLWSLVILPFVIWAWQLASKNLNEPKSITPACAATVSAHLLVGLVLIAVFASLRMGFASTFPASMIAVSLIGFLLIRYILRQKNAFNSAKQTFK